MLGEQLLVQKELPVGFELLSTKKVVKLMEQDKISESFLLLIKPDSSLHEMSLSQEEIFSKAVPGQSIPELQMRLLLAENVDLFRTELPEVNMFKNTRSVILWYLGHPSLTGRCSGIPQLS